MSFLPCAWLAALPSPKHSWPPRGRRLGGSGRPRSASSRSASGPSALDSLARLTSSGLRRESRKVCVVLCVCFGLGSSWRTSVLLEFCVASRSADLFEVCIERRTRPARLSSSGSASGARLFGSCLCGRALWPRRWGCALFGAARAGPRPVPVVCLLRGLLNAGGDPVI
jgi:hypothetical protein